MIRIHCSRLTLQKRGFQPAVDKPTLNTVPIDVVRPTNMHQGGQSSSPQDLIIVRDQTNSRKPRFQCQICKKIGQTADRCWKRFDKEFNIPSSSNQQQSSQNVNQVQQALSALKLTGLDVIQWLPDSGASSHMTGNKSVFSTLTCYTGSDVVYVGNGKGLPITHWNCYFVNNFWSCCVE